MKHCPYCGKRLWLFQKKTADGFGYASHEECIMIDACKHNCQACGHPLLANNFRIERHDNHLHDFHNMCIVVEQGVVIS